ncbi:MAG: YciI family protein [Nitrospirales bacterium]|nr:YciI family protein [Nitrospirales bacterium]
MKYLLFCCHEEKKFDSMPKSEGDALMNETLTYCETLKRSGHLIVAKPLEPIQMAVTVRVRNGGLSLTDGPFAETMEQIGGFFLIEARDINQAVQIASKFPSVRLGSIEVRPVKELPRQEIEGEAYQDE